MLSNAEQQPSNESHPICVLCQGLGVTPVPIEERWGFVDGPQWPTTTIVLHAKGFAGFGSLEPGETFAKRLAIREINQLDEWPDDLLISYLDRLRRQLVMLEEDQVDGWFAQSIQRRYDQADRELQWRKRASLKGGPPLRDTKEWRKRIEIVKRNADLVKLIAWENLQATPTSSSKWKCCCPFHHDTTPSLDIDTNKNVWYCHVCQIGGDSFSYIMTRYGVTFYEALIYLEGRLGS